MCNQELVTTSSAMTPKNHPNSDLEDAEIGEASGAQRETTEQSFMPRKMAWFDEREGWWRTMALEVMVKE